MAGNYRDPLYMATLSYDSTEFRQHLAACSTPGVRTVPTTITGDLAVTASGSMVLNVAAGFAVITGNFTSNQGNYIGQNTATSTATIGTAPGTGQSRIDRVIGVVYDDGVGVQSGGSNEWKVVVVAGTAASTGSQVAPTITQNNYLELAQVLVGANVTQILSGAITDKRVVAEHPSLSGRYVDFASAQTITGAKRFSAGVARGSGPTRGYNALTAHRSTTFNLAGTSFVSPTWTTYVFNSQDTITSDNGGLAYNTLTGLITLDGAYTINGTVSIKAPSGYAAVRIVTAGGSCVYQFIYDNSTDAFGVFPHVFLPFHWTGVYTGDIHVEVAQQTNAPQPQPLNANITPCRLDVIGFA